jgi:sirohydrochlorin ferrochelatase
MTKETILLVAHGARDPDNEGNAEVESFADRWHHLGTTEELLKARRHRLHQAMVRLAMPDPRTTGVVLLARGASDKEATGEVAKMAHWLFETTHHEQLLDLLDLRLRQCREGSTLSPYDGNAHAIDARTSQVQPSAA